MNFRVLDEYFLEYYSHITSHAVVSVHLIMFANEPYLLSWIWWECRPLMKRCRKNIKNGLRIIAGAMGTLISSFNSRRSFTLIRDRASLVGVWDLSHKACNWSFLFSNWAWILGMNGLNWNLSIANFSSSFNANSHSAVTSIMEEMKSLQHSSPYPLYIFMYERLNGK